jgi:hypothetical protein
MKPQFGRFGHSVMTDVLEQRAIDAAAAIGTASASTIVRRR